MQALSGEQVVFFPGLDGTGMSYEPLRPFVAADACVKVVQYPPDKMQSFIEAVDCAAAQLPPFDSAVVVAESFSGPIAVELIASGRLKAKLLVLCATFARSPRPVLLGLGQYLPLATIMSLPIPQPLLAFALGAPEFTDALLPMWYRVREAVSPAVLAHRLRVVSRVDVRSKLAELSIPCLYIQASGDVVVPESAVLDFVEAIPDLQVKSVRGPHFILQANPREAVAVIEQFKNSQQRPACRHSLCRHSLRSCP